MQIFSEVTKARRPSLLLRLPMALCLLLVGIQLMLVGVVVLPLALLLRDVRQKYRLEEGPLVWWHGVLACLLWLGLNCIFEGWDRLKRC